MMVGVNRFVLFEPPRNKAITKPGHGWQRVKGMSVHWSRRVDPGVGIEWVSLEIQSILYLAFRRK